MSTLADRTIAALRSNHDDLAVRIGKFDDDDLARQSGASDWDVAQVLSHLGSGAEIALAGLRAGLAGEETPGRDFNQPVWDRWNAMDRRGRADAFLQANEELVRAYENLDATARQEVQLKLGFLPFPIGIGGIAGMRLNEASLHGWDVRVASDPAATLSAEEAGVLLDQFGGPLAFLLGFTGKPAALDGNEATLRVHTTDPERVIGLQLGPTIALIEPPVDPDGVLTGPAEAMLRLLAGRLRTPESVSLSGDAVTFEELATVFPGY